MTGRLHFKCHYDLLFGRVTISSLWSVPRSCPWPSAVPAPSPTSRRHVLSPRALLLLLLLLLLLPLLLPLLPLLLKLPGLATIFNLWLLHSTQVSSQKWQRIGCTRERPRERNEGGRERTSVAWIKCMLGQQNYLSETWVYRHLFRRYVSPLVTVLTLWLSFRRR